MIETSPLLVAAIASSIGSLLYLFGRLTSIKYPSFILILLAYGLLSSAGLITLLSITHIHSLGFSGFHFHIDQIPSTLFQGIEGCHHYLTCEAITIFTVAGGVFASAFFLNQAAGHVMLGMFEMRTDATLSKELSQKYDTKGSILYVIKGEAPDAFAYAALGFRRMGIPKVRNIMILTTALVKLLEPGELETVIAHEAAHIKTRDNQYISFLHTLSALLFFDPIMRYAKGKLMRRREFAADEEASIATKKPLSLARALFKVYMNMKPGFQPVNILGGNRRSLLMERINRLVSLAEKTGYERIC